MLQLCCSVLALIVPQSLLLSITKTFLYNFDPFEPHFYIVKLGFTGVYIIFSYFCSGEAVLTSTHNRPKRFLRVSTIYFFLEQKYDKYQNILSKIFHFSVVTFSAYLKKHFFVMIVLLYVPNKYIIYYKSYLQMRKISGNLFVISLSKTYVVVAQ